MREYFLRKLKLADAPRMLEWQHDEVVMQYLQFDGTHMTLADAQKFIESAQDCSRNLHLAVTSDDDKYYGTISLKNIDKARGDAEYAIALHPDSWGGGTFVSLKLLHMAFVDLGLKRVYLNVLEDNRRAVRLYEKLGFRYMYADKINFKGQADTVLRWYEIKPEYLSAWNRNAALHIKNEMEEQDRRGG